jgi:hypothetical protein
MWKNSELDENPVLIEAVLIDSADIEGMDLGLVFFDEDKDVLGIQLEERSIPSGEVKIFEDYPTYYYTYFNNPVYFGVLPIHMRSKDAKKDDEEWKKYFEESFPMRSDLESISIPTIYISIPDEQTEVYVSVYDRKGNKSNKVKLLDKRRYGESNESQEVKVIRLPK